MPSLEDILTIADKKEREQQLILYASSFHIDVSEIRNPQGEIDESQLSVLIYDAEQKKKSSKFQNIAMGVFGLIIMLIVIAAIIFLSNMMSGMTSGN